jgi:hypothetical protein
MSSDDNAIVPEKSWIVPEKYGIVPERFYSPKAVARFENVCLATVYVRLAAGEYQAFRDGAKTQIPGEAILARRSKLQPAVFKAPRPVASRFPLKAAL